MKAVFLSLYSGTYQHSIPEASLSRELRRRGTIVEHLTCGGLLNRQCHIISSSSSARRWHLGARTTCAQCQGCSQSLFDKMETSLLTLLSDCAPQDLAQVESIVQALSPNTVYDFSWEGLPIGRLAAYQHLIRLKKFEATITEYEWPVFTAEIRNCLLVYYALKQWQKVQVNLPNFAFMYNSLYAVNATARHFFERLGIVVFSIHAGPNLHHFHDTLMLARGDTVSEIQRQKQCWAEEADAPVTSAEAKWVSDHFLELARGRSVFAYSSPADGRPVVVRDFWKIPVDCKIVLAGMSSYDERFAVEYTGVVEKSRDAVFQNQIEWITSLVDFARSRPKLFFIVRLHPREFPNKREKVLSKHAQLILSSLRNLPSNVVINTPEDGLSIYEIAREIDLVLTSWSSVAKELMLVGIPAVLFTSDMQDYPTQGLWVARSKSEYFKLIDKALLGEWSIDFSRNMFRWYAFESYRSILKFTTNLSYGANRYSILFWRILWRFWPFALINFRVGKITGGQEILDRLLSELPGITRQRASSSDAEFKIHIRSIKQIAGLFWGSETNWPSSFKAMLNRAVQ